MLARRPRGRFALGDLDGADSDLAAARIVLRVELHLLAFTQPADAGADRKSTRLNSSHSQISYAVFCLKKKKKNTPHGPRPALPHPAHLFADDLRHIAHYRLAHAHGHTQTQARTAGSPPRSPLTLRDL